MDRPPMKPRCSAATSGPTSGASNDLAALASMRLSAFVALRGRTCSSSQMPPPVSVEPENYLGRKNMRAPLKPPNARPKNPKHCRSTSSGKPRTRHPQPH
eukprot:2605687-Pyramimonas_sp.AAC.1